MKKCIIKLLVSCIVLMICFSIVPKSYSLVTSQFQGAESLLGTAGQASDNIMKAIIDVIRYIGAAVSLGVLMVIGIKYAIASAGERADIKKYAVNYIIGAIILFASSGILTIVRTFAENSTQ